MTTLTGKTPAATYKDLLQVSNSNAGVDGTLRDVEDGEGTVSALQLSTTEAKVSGNVTTTGLFVNSVTTGVSAGATQTQVGATALTAGINEIGTCATLNDGVKLPTAVAGLQITIINNGAQSAQVWPATGDAINGGAVDAVDATVIATSKVRVYHAIDATNWYSYASPA